ncbi:DnaJ domain-containing protein [Desulfogranum japonicum]|uniref:DnaJ domain-containing protein n=1 Tax=Desulfogranum japonicum TaxID=231447 RepID=UPI00041BD657|nr:DnaJ domain-containing protein [Desulfogranum japonicum]
MKTPYELLDISEQSNDEQVRQAYLGMVRRYPPEQHPEMFQKIFDAYELIGTEEKRLSYALFHRQLPTVADVFELLVDKRAAPVSSSPEEFAAALQSGVGTFCRKFTL